MSGQPFVSLTNHTSSRKKQIPWPFIYSNIIIISINFILWSFGEKNRSYARNKNRTGPYIYDIQLQHNRIETCFHIQKKIIATARTCFTHNKNME